MLEDLPYLSLFPFFSLSTKCRYVSSKEKWSQDDLVCDTSSYLHETPFASLYFGWYENGLRFRLEAKKPFEKVDAADYTKGDALEISIDTRDLKTKTSHAFCHQFVIFPEKVGGYFGKEITPYHFSDNHPLCDPQELGVKVEIEKKMYALEIDIPSSCLYGFDPLHFQKFGFAYRVFQPQGLEQNFCLSPFEFSLSQESSFWCSVEMVKKK